MAKDLFLIRHAEADADNFDIKDIERPLTPDGEIMASKVGRYFKNSGLQPQAIIASPAMRTRQTSGFLVEQIDFDPKKIQINEDLYEASTRILLKAINELPGSMDRVIIVAHNPAVSYLSEYLTGEIIGNVSPAGIVHLKYEGEWAEFSQNSIELVHYTTPKEID